jgi:hypothetical protein
MYSAAPAITITPVSFFYILSLFWSPFITVDKKNLMPNFL